MKILLVGCGAMGSALLEKWHLHYDVCVVDPLYSGAYKDIEEIPNDYVPNIIVLAIKPQVLPSIIEAYTQRFKSDDIHWVSIAAGTTLAFLCKYIVQSKNVVRCMPNLPARFGKGMSVLVSAHGNAEDISSLFRCSGEVLWLENENQMDAVTAIAGSGPAYFYLMVEELIKSAEKLGLNPDVAALLARQTAIGVGLTLENLNTPVSELRRQVTSPGGTTEAALSVLMPSLGVLLEKATKAASDRSRELAKS